MTLEQVGTNVVATGSGKIDLTDLTFNGTFFNNPLINPENGIILTGAGMDYSGYISFTGSGVFGTGGETNATIGSGDLAGISLATGHLFVPDGYVSGNPLSDTATYDSQTFSTLGVTPGTYEWTWGSGADADSFTLQIGAAAVPAPPIGHGLPVALAVGGILFGTKLLERSRRRRHQFS